MLATRIIDKLHHYNRAALVRKRVTLTERGVQSVRVNGRYCINFSSNDYLGLANHSAVKKACINGIAQYGVGSGSSALISGYFKAQRMLEVKFAEFLNRDKAIFLIPGIWQI